MYAHSIRELLNEICKIFRERRFFYSVRYCFWVMIDWIRGVDYIKNEGYEKTGTSSGRASVYQATRDIACLKKVIGMLPVKKTDAIVDLGCGKGYMLKVFSRYAFYKVGGVELSERLSSIARQNIKKERLGKCIVYHADAGEFRQYDGYTYIYMFNPFPAAVMEKVMDNIRESISRKPRKMFIIYKGPFCHEIIIGGGTFLLSGTVKGKTLPYYIYTSVSG